ncbi:MAG: DUF424 domain-containing protein [Candidatus Thorarchaeota archaeon]
MSSVYMKIRQTHEHVMVTICDAKLLGKTLKDGKITFNVSEDFYGGDLVDVETCLKFLKKATIANMIGNVTVEAAKNAGLVHETAVLYIDGNAHAQWVRL